MSKSTVVPRWARQLVASQHVNPNGVSGFAQERIEIVGDITPLFLFRVGAYGSAQSDLMKGLAENLEAQFVSGAAIKARTMRRTAEYTQRRTSMVRGEFTRTVMDTLNAGHDTVGDLAFNTRSTRGALLHDIDQNGLEPLVIAVNTVASRGIVKERVERMIAEGTVEGIRVDAYERSPLEIALENLKQLEVGGGLTYAVPTEEMIDYVVEVDGTKPTIFAINDALSQLPADIVA